MFKTLNFTFLEQKLTYFQMELSILVHSDGGNVTLAVLDKPKKMLQAVLSVPIQEVSKCKMSVRLFAARTLCQPLYSTLLLKPDCYAEKLTV